MTCAREVAARWFRWSAGGVVLGLLVLAACSKKEAANETAAAGTEAAAPAAAPAPAADAAAGDDSESGPDPCGFVPAARIQALVGMDPGKGERLLQTCQYATVKLLIHDASTFDHEKTATAQSTPVTDLPGMGDAAFMYEVGPITNVNIRKGDTYVAASVIRDDIPAAKRQEMAKAVAMELLKAASK